MKKEVLAQAETWMAATIPTVIFVAVFVGIIFWVFLRNQSTYKHLENLPLD